MPPFLAYVLAAVLGYLVGSVSFAVLIARSRGVDIFTVGSGNPGATNVLRTLGKGPGYLCFFLDALKGMAAVQIGYGLATQAHSVGILLPIVALFAAILGHSFSIFLDFRGGKGVATTIGGLLTLMPLVMVVGLLVWVAIFFSTRYVSLASLGLGASLPLSTLVLPQYRWPHVFLSLIVAALIFVRHRKNIERLRAGTEPRSRFGQS